jgi:PAS domain S-box-containing protein
MMRGMSSPRRESDLIDMHALVDSIPALIHTARPDGYLDYFNKPWLEYLGVTLDRVTGWNWTAFVHPEDVEGIVAKWRACLATGEVFEYETRFRSANGEYRWMLHRKEPLRNANGNIVKWYGSSLDIEVRKRAEEELRRSEFYLSEGQRLAHMGSWVLDPAGSFPYWSHELFYIYGLDPAKKGPSFEEYLASIHPQDREFMRSLITRMIAEASGCDVTKRIVRPSGEVRYVRCVAVPIVENGMLKRIVGSAIDITGHELLTQELGRREAYLTEAQRLSHTGSFGWRPDSGEIVWSEEIYRIFEYDRSVKPTIDSLVQRVHPEDRMGVKEVINRSLEGEPEFEHAYRLLLPDGRVKHVHAIAHVLQDASGNREFVGAATDITERKTSEDKIRRLVDTNILGIFTGNFEGAIFEANDAFLRMVQYSREDVVSGRLRWTDLTPPEWRERDECAVAEVKATGTIQPCEKEYFRKDSSRVPVMIGSALFAGGNEGVVFVLDLSEQKRAQEARRSSEAYLAEAQRLAHMGSWAWSPDQGTRYCSEEWYRVLGFDPRDGLPRFEDFFQRIHPDDQPGFRELIQTAIRQKAEWEADYRIVHPGGAIRDIHVVCHPVLSTSGHLVEFVGTVIDVTERKRAEEERRRSEMELQQMLDLAPQQVAVFGPGGERLYANRSGLDYVGLSLEEWQQTPGTYASTRSSFIHPDDRERAARTHSERARSGGSAYELELRLRKRDGTDRWFLVRYNPLRDEQGQITRWYVAATDIEDRKQAEDRLRSENVALREEIDKASMSEEIVGTSQALKAVLSRISKVARSDSTVLITGETGTGKELVARAIHRISDRASRAFVSVNCAAIPRDLIASELFGHEKGAFTGATQQRLGRFELANGGTLFLDEVGELPAETQIALLRVLQEHEFERVGGTRRIRADVRVIAATNRDLQAAISAGSFRSDLFYRLHVFPIEIPSLRERREDIPMLVEYFIERYARKAGKQIKRINKKTLELLQSYAWPGNIRELQNVIERSMILCETEIFSIDENWLPPHLTLESKRQVGLRRRFLLQEKDMIETALKDTGGRVAGPTGAAVKLGMPRSTMESKIRSFKINKNRFKI